MINNNDKAYILMSAFELTHKKCRDIVEHYDEVGDFLSALDNDDNFARELFGKDYDSIKKRHTEFSFDAFEKYLLAKNVKYVTIEHDNYPKALFKSKLPL